MFTRVSFFGLIVALTSLPVPAQSTFAVTPSQIPGIQVHGSGSLEFERHLTDLGMGTATREAAAAVLARAIVVTNTTNRPVTKFVVRFEYRNRNGKGYSENQWQEPGVRFEPGTSLLITASRAFTESIRSHRSGTPQVASGSVLEAIIHSPVGRVALDSVLFADGDFFGADAAGAWNMLSEEREFVRATRAELEGFGADFERIQRKLNELHEPMVARKQVPGEGLRVTMMREKMYGELMGLARKGYEPFRTALQERFGEQSLTVLRRKF